MIESPAKLLINLAVIVAFFTVLALTLISQYHTFLQTYKEDIVTQTAVMTRIPKRLPDAYDRSFYCIYNYTTGSWEGNNCPNK